MSSQDVTLSLLYAQLELRPEFAYIRAITPLYAVYEYKAHSMLYENARQDASSAGKAVHAYAKLKTKYSIDVAAAATGYGLRREDIVSKLNEWSDQSWIDLKPSQRRNRYRLLKELPTSEAVIHDVADKMFAEMLKREDAEVARMEGVFQWAAAPTCLPKSLATYFGDGADVLPGAATCGHCTVCANGGAAAVTYAYAPPAFDEARFAAVLAAVGPVRDDARFLARVAFGVTSPRITAEKLGRDAAFGAMSDHRWDELLARCEAEVATWRAENPGWTKPAAAEPAAKRKSTSSGYDGGASAPKRGRGASSSGSTRGRGASQPTSGASRGGAKRGRAGWGR